MRNTFYVMLVLASFVHAGVTDFQYISPAPASELNTCQSTIIIREGSRINLLCPPGRHQDLGFKKRF